MTLMSNNYKYKKEYWGLLDIISYGFFEKFCQTNIIFLQCQRQCRDDAEIRKPRFPNDRNLPNTSIHFFCIAGVNSFFQNFHLPKCRVNASNIIRELCYSTAYKVSVFGAVLVRIFRHLG